LESDRSLIKTEKNKTSSLDIENAIESGRIHKVSKKVVPASEEVVEES